MCNVLKTVSPVIPVTLVTVTMTSIMLKKNIYLIKSSRFFLGTLSIYYFGQRPFLNISRVKIYIYIYFLN